MTSGLPLDFRTSHLDDALEEKLEDALFSDTSQVMLHDIAQIGRQHDPVDLAHTVSRLPPSARVVVYDNLPDLDAKIIFMINTGSNTRTAIFRQIQDSEIKQLLEKIPPDEAVWMLDDMSDRRMRRVLDLLEAKKAHSIRELQKHDRHSAGRLMTNEFFSFHLNTTIGEVSTAIRENPGIDLTRVVYVYDNDNNTIGFVPGRNLIVNPPYIPIRQVMRPITHQVEPSASRDEVVDIVERYKIPALPVIKDNQMVGVITYEDIVEVMEDIADETIASIAGTGEDVSEHEPIYRKFLWRAPWLLVTLCAGLVTSTVMSRFDVSGWFRYMAFFVPLIVGMSGNVGIQCSTTLVRSLSTGELSYSARGDAMAKEIGIGMLSGTTFGVICGLVVYLLYHYGIHIEGADELRIGLTVSAGVFVACMTATVLGTFSPFFFARMNIDPAVASGPIVTAFNDVLSSLMFFLVARSLYYLFQ
ncbi:MAG: magnesium transporter [Chlamydiota bacterium]|nr:magnesium transporter [Chlamydiota bacterium]